MVLNLAGQKEDIALENTMKNDATKRQGYIAPLAMIKTRNFITVMSFTGLIQRQGLSSWNINIVWNKYSVDC